MKGEGKRKKKKREGRRACVSFSPRQAVAPKSDNPLNVAEAVSYDVTWMEGRGGEHGCSSDAFSI